VNRIIPIAQSADYPLKFHPQIAQICKMKKSLNGSGGNLNIAYGPMANVKQNQHIYNKH